MMQSHRIFFALMLYSFIGSAQANHEQQPHRSSISITINTKPNSNCQTDNQINQEAKHASLPMTQVDAAIQQKAKQISNETNDAILNTIVTWLWPPVGLIMYCMRNQQSKE